MISCVCFFFFQSTEIPEQFPNSEDLITFFSSEAELKNISFEGKKSALWLLCTTGLVESNEIPPIVILNVISIFASTNELYNALSYGSTSEFNALLTMITKNPCVLYGTSTKVRIRFLDGLLSLSPGVLKDIPKSVLISILGTVNSLDVLNALSLPATMNLITTLSLSKPLFSYLPYHTFMSVLTFIAKKSPYEITVLLPPSTLFGFYEGFLEILNDSPSTFEKTIPISLIDKMLAPIMTSRMLSVFPISNFDQLLAFMSSKAGLCVELPPSYFVSLFNTLNSSPKILISLNPYNLANVMLAVQKNVPDNIYSELLHSIAIYLPSAQNFVYRKTS